jgi:subtilisin family serine protease
VFAANFVWLVAAALFLFFGRNSHAQRTVFRETFEGIFPGEWTVGDFGGAGAYWSDVDLRFFGAPPLLEGNWAGYCAGIGFAGTVQFPDYQPEMLAVMERTVDLTTATNATLSFWYTIPSIEPGGFDYCRLLVNGNRLWLADSPANWTQVTTNLQAFVGGMVTVRFEFVSDEDFQLEGCYLDDILLTASPDDGGGGNRPNLTPHQPEGWSDKIVVSRVTGTTTDDSDLQAGDTLYLDWAVINNGSADVTSTFTTQLYVDDQMRTSWSGGSLPPNFFSNIRDYNLGTLPAGTHTVKIVTDSGNTVNESNEADNEYIKTIVIGGQPEIRIAPLELTFTVTNDGGSGFAARADTSTPENPNQSVPHPDPLPEGEGKAPGVASAEEAIAFNLSAEQKLQAAHEVAGLLDGGAGEVAVIVNLASPPGKPLHGEWDSKPRLRQWHQAVKGRQDDVLAILEADDFKVRRRYENLSAFSGHVTRKGLEKLARHPRVASVELSRQRHAHLAQGIPLMNAAIYRSTYDGTGTSVAIIDSGVDYNHPRLGGGGFPNTKVIGGRDFGDDDNNPIPEGNAHGTACAGIAAGAPGTSGDYIGGVAPNAKVYALKITSGASGSAFDADIIAAWDWCVSHKNDDPANPILVISTSFGGDRYTSGCDVLQSSYFTAANNAVAAGITVLASSGNEGYCTALASPACISSVISVGAVYDSGYASSTSFCVEELSCVSKSPSGSCFSGWTHSEPVQADRVTGYSNTSGFLDLLAPSHRAYTTDIVGADGYSGGDYDSAFGGTSAACPYAAGAVAALQSAARAIQGRYLTPAEARTILATTGDLVRDGKNTTITKPRVNLGRAIESLGQSRSFTIFNEGNGTLNVTSIVADASAPWISLTPPAPFTVPAGGAQVVAVAIDPALAPAGHNTRRLLVGSDDADESPYPGGVSITVTNIDTRPQISAVLSGTRFIVSWTTNSAEYVLQSSDSLTGNWGAVNTAPVTVGASRYVTNNVAPPRRFYRLRKP